LLSVGILVVPRAVRYVVGLDRAETTLVASIGFCFGVALLAKKAGASSGRGSARSSPAPLIAESGKERKVEHLVQPVRDMFGAIFFVAVGMSIDLRLIAEQWPAVLLSPLR